MPLWWSLDAAPGPGTAAARGALFGAVAYAGGHAWLFRLVPVFLAGDWVFGSLVWGLYGVAFSACFAAYGALYAALRRAGTGRGSAGVAGWVAMEWLQPLVFPVHAGSAAIDPVLLAQTAELGGPLLLSAGVAWLNLAVYEAWRGARGLAPLPWARIAATGCLFAAAVAFGQWRIAGFEARIARAEPVRVGLVQANLGLLEKRTAVETGHRQHLAQSRELLADGPLDLLIWPETAYARALRGPLPLAGQMVRREIDVPLLFGGTLIEDPGDGPVQTNAALLVGSDGVVRDAYRKNLLIPLAERVPFLDRVPALAQRLPRAQRFGAARQVPALSLGERRISVPICYEAIRPGFVRRMVRAAEPHLLVTIANDAWFGDSREPLIHLQLARMRAIEHRRHLVRATNGGISAIIDPLGRVVARTALLERANLRGQITWLAEPTLYTRLGDWPGPLAALWLVVALRIATPRRAARAATRPGAA